MSASIFVAATLVVAFYSQSWLEDSGDKPGRDAISARGATPRSYKYAKPFYSDYHRLKNLEHRVSDS